MRITGQGCSSGASCCKWSRRRQMIVGKNLQVKSEEVCGNRLYTLYTVVAAIWGTEVGRSPWAVQLFRKLTSALVSSGDSDVLSDASSLFRIRKASRLIPSSSRSPLFSSYRHGNVHTHTLTFNITTTNRKYKQYILLLMCYQHLFKAASGICAYWWFQIICASIFIMSFGHT